MPLTKTQRRVMRAIARRIKKHGYAPTVRELCHDLKISSENGVREHLNRLKAAGYLDWVPRKARTLRILREP